MYLGVACQTLKGNKARGQPVSFSGGSSRFVRVCTCAGMQFSEYGSADSSAISGWSVQGFIQVLCFCVRFYFSNVWLDVHGFNTNLKETRMGFIKPGPKILRWIHVRQR